MLDLKVVTNLSEANQIHESAEHNATGGVTEEENTR